MKVVMPYASQGSFACGRTSCPKMRIGSSERGRFTKLSKPSRSRFSMAVMVVMLFRTLNHWNDAAVRHFAHYMFELNSRVVDTEVVQQPFFYVAENAFAHRRRNVRD